MIKKLFEKKEVKFLFVGGLNTIVGYSLFVLFIYLGFFYPFAVLMATILGVLFNFKSIGHIVFNHKDNTRFFHFVLVYVVVYLVNIFGLWGLERLGLSNKYFAGFCLIIPVAILSYYLNKKYVFIRSEDEKEN